MQYCFYYKELLIFGSEHAFKYCSMYIQKNPRVAFPVRKTNNWRYSESHCNLRSQARQVNVIHDAQWALMRFLSIPCKGVWPTVYGRRGINPWFLVQQISCNKKDTPSNYLTGLLNFHFLQSPPTALLVEILSSEETVAWDEGTGQTRVL